MIRAFFTVSGFTLMSRVLGLVRDVLIAQFLGRGWISDAFYRAFSFPNMFRRIFGEGAFNAAFVPIFSKKLAEGTPEQAKEFAQISFSWLCLMLLLSSLLAMSNMGFIVSVWLPFLDKPEAISVTVKYTLICFPYLSCIALAAHLSGVLNSLKKFGTSAFSPVLLNLVFIGGLAVVVPLAEWNGSENWMKINAGYVCVTCVLVAGFLQLALLWHMARQNGFTLLPTAFKWNGDIRKLFLLMGPGVLTAGIQQINLLLSQTIASQKDGVTSLIYNADRINQFPLGLVGVAIGVVLLPEVSRALGANNRALANEKMNQALEFAMLLVIPAAVALFVLSEPICRLVFARGNYTVYDAQLTGETLAIFSLGLPAYVGAKVFQAGYFARENTKSPMLFALVVVLVNLGLAFLLFPKLEHLGLAYATAAAGWVNVILLAIGLVKSYRPSALVVKKTLLILLSSLLMGGALLLGKELLSAYVYLNFWTELFSLIALIALGGVVYGGFCLLLKITTVSLLLNRFTKKS